MTNHDYPYIILFLEEKDKVLHNRVFQGIHLTDFCVGSSVNAVNLQIYAFLIPGKCLLITATEQNTSNDVWQKQQAPS